MEIKNFSDVIVYDPKTLTKKILFNTKESLCFVLNLMPGQTIPAHRHENSLLTAAVLKGECKIAVNQDQYTLSEGNVFMIEGQDDFAIPEVKKNLSLYVTLSPNPENPAYGQGIE